MATGRTEALILIVQGKTMCDNGFDLIELVV